MIVMREILNVKQTQVHPGDPLRVEVESILGRAPCVGNRSWLCGRHGLRGDCDFVKRVSKAGHWK
jgi:hypothetical protein